MLNDFFLKNEKKRIEWVSKALWTIKKWESILDAGAGEMQYKTYCNHLLYTSQDFNQYDGKWDGIGWQMWEWKRKTDITSDITTIPVDNNSFDNILCTEVFEHIPYPDDAVREFSRVLKKWWRLILTAPFCSLTHFSPYYFCNGFSEYWYKTILSKYDFEILELEKNGNYFNYLEQEVARLPLMAKKYSRSGYFIFAILGFFSLLQIFLLKYLSKRDTWSNEMLYFGTHIIAIKK